MNESKTIEYEMMPLVKQLVDEIEEQILEIYRWRSCKEELPSESSKYKTIEVTLCNASWTIKYIREGQNYWRSSVGHFHNAKQLVEQYHFWRYTMDMPSEEMKLKYIKN